MGFLLGVVGFMMLVVCLIWLGLAVCGCCDFVFCWFCWFAFVLFVGFDCCG